MDILDKFYAFACTKHIDKKLLRMLKRDLLAFKQEEAKAVSPTINLIYYQVEPRYDTLGAVIQSNNRIATIRVLREYFDLGLKDAMDMVESVIRGKILSFKRPYDNQGKDLTSALNNALKHSGACLTVGGL